MGRLLDQLIVILLQLADERQHRREMRQPLFAQTVRQALLALYSCEPDGGLVGPHIPKNRTIQLFVMACGVGHDHKLRERGDDLRGHRDFCGMVELRQKRLRYWGEMGRRLPEI